jgi:hypothetical protein
MKPAFLLVPLLIALLSACGGGSSAGQPLPERAPAPTPQPLPVVTAPPQPAARVLHYSDPRATGFRLEVDPATNDTGRLLLHLKGPAAARIRGVACFFQIDPEQLLWSPPAANPELLVPGPGWPRTAIGPSLVRARADHGILQFGLFLSEQEPLRLDDGILATVALEAIPGGRTGRVMLRRPADDRSILLDGERTFQPLTVAMGALTMR